MRTVSVTKVKWLPPVVIVRVYASCQILERMRLWCDLNMPWMVIGDFNNVVCQEEKAGGCLINRDLVAHFRDTIQNSGLTDMRYTCNKYTWWNKRAGKSSVLQRLDRAMCNTD